MHQLPQDLVQKMLDVLVASKALSLQALALFLDDQLQRVDLNDCGIVNDALLRAIARHSKNIERYYRNRYSFQTLSCSLRRL